MLRLRIIRRTLVVGVGAMVLCAPVYAASDASSLPVVSDASTATITSPSDGESGADGAATTAPAPAAGDAKAGPSIGGRPQIYDRWVCPVITSQGERTSGIFGRSATIRYQTCAYRSRSSNVITFNTNATQWPGTVSINGNVASRISITRRGASNPGYVGQCTKSFIPTSTRQPFFGGGSILRPYFFGCSAGVRLSSRLTYKVQGRLCYDVKDDGKGTRCIYSTQYL
jgi:hypothetical protein